jgi:glutamate N-acetyltransferase/amino-acid N-acetyltransferase
MSEKISPLAPKSFPQMPQISGVKLAVAECGIKYTHRADVMVAELAKGTVAAGAFTKSKTASANIWWGKDAIKSGKGRLLVVNSGNANAFNGKCGEDSVSRIVDACAALWGCQREEVFPSSTGVIGQPLPDSKIILALSAIKSKLQPDAWEDAAKAIMTTDTYAKAATRTAKIGGTLVKINGIAKGSGMIAPDMATMLAYVFTDAAISREALQDMINSGVANSFNSITVDSDTSTSDTLLAFATCKAGNEKITYADDAGAKDFKEKLDSLLLELAHLVVKDGEGATKFITIKVTGAENNKAAKIIGMAIANSPLVKTAIAGEDANWGRIVMAVGKSGEEAHRDKMSVWIGGINIVKDGQLNSHYVEEEVTAHMRGQNIDIEVYVGAGDGVHKVWTCDLTDDYIRINADYRS